MNRLRRILVVPILFMFFIIISAPLSMAGEGVPGQGSAQQAATAGLSSLDHSLMKQLVTAITSTSVKFENQLNVMMQMPASSRIEAWQNVHDIVAPLNSRCLELQQQTSALKRKNLGKSDWSALNQSCRSNLSATQAKLKSIRGKYLTLSKVAGQLQDLKSNREELESKFKAVDQQRNSDYQILISIIKSIDEELSIFNKGLE
jgi:hypothetical protein